MNLDFALFIRVLILYEVDWFGMFVVADYGCFAVVFFLFLGIETETVRV